MPNNLYQFLNDQQHPYLNGDDYALLAQAIIGLSEAAVNLHQHCCQGQLMDDFSTITVHHNHDGDTQKILDIYADNLFLETAKQYSIHDYASEEQPTIITANSEGAFALAIDPLDGSSNIANNITIGTIFSLWAQSNKRDSNNTITHSFTGNGRQQLAAGYFMYGTQLNVVLTIGTGTYIFTYSDDKKQFFMINDGPVTITSATTHYAINASNQRYWPPYVKDYIELFVEGADGKRGKNYNMRWVGSLVADHYRLLMQGGVFLYPEDMRPLYQQGRLRLLYECYPIAFLTEQAGGMASNGCDDILDVVIYNLHQRVPFIAGSRDEVTYYNKLKN